MAMTNAVGLITKYAAEAWDETYAAEAQSRILDTNRSMVEWTGAKTVKIMKTQEQGLGFYTRNNYLLAEQGFKNYDGQSEVEYYGGEGGALGTGGAGYPRRGSAAVWEERTLRVDRGGVWGIEKFDNEEAGGRAVGHIMTDIAKKHAIPEIDAYVFSELSKNAGKIVDSTSGNVDPKMDANQNVYLPDEAGYASATIKAPLATLHEGLTYIIEQEVDSSDIVVFLSPRYHNALRNSRELTKFIDTKDNRNQNVSYTITQYEGHTFIEVVPRRFHTEIQLLAEGDFALTANSRSIDFIVMDKNACSHIVKYEKTKVLEGTEALLATNMDGYAIYFRIYHDLFVWDNKKVGIYEHVGYFDTKASDGTVTLASTPTIAESFALTLTSANKVTGIVQLPARNFVRLAQATGTAAVANGTAVDLKAIGTNYPEIRAGDTIADKTKVVIIGPDGKIIANGLSAANAITVGDEPSA